MLSKATAGEDSTLWVDSSWRLAARGLAVNLVEREGRIRFEINRAAAARAGLRISSQLLDLALPPGTPAGPGGS